MPQQLNSSPEKYEAPIVNDEGAKVDTSDESTSGRHLLIEDAFSSQSTLPSMEKNGQSVVSVIELPGDNLPETSIDDQAELSRPSDYEYLKKPETMKASGGETIDSIAKAKAKEFLGDENYADLEADPANLNSFVNSYKKALAHINGVDEKAVFKPGQEITVPGKNGSIEPIYIKDGKIMVWSGNSVTTRSKDGTTRTDWDDNTYSIHRPDETSESKNILGVVTRTRPMEGGGVHSSSSDGSYSKEFPDGSSESQDEHGTKTVIDKNGKVTNTYRTGEVMIHFPDGRSEHTLKDKSVIKTAKDKTSEKFDKSGKLIGRGLENGRFQIEFETTDNGVTENKLTSYARKEYNFNLTESRDRIELREKDSTDSKTFVSDGDYKSLDSSRTELLANVESRIDHPIMKAKFKADMIRFENRAKERGLPGKEVEQVYKDLNRILSADQDTPIDLKGRTQIANELISDLASPYTISQGQHGTCNVKILHVVMAAKHPTKVSGLISEAALTGKYTLGSGNEVVLPEGTLKRHNDSLTYPRFDGQRGFAGQLYDATVINALYQETGNPFRLNQFDPDPSLKGYKSGDILVHKNSGKPVIFAGSGGVLEFSGLIGEDIVQAYRLVMNDNSEKDWLLYSNYPDNQADGVKSYKTEAELTDILTRLKEEGAFPFPIHVNTRMAPFWNDSGAGIAGGSGGAHVLNITDFDPKTGRVMIDNQWNTYNDRLSAKDALPVKQLYLASLNEMPILRHVDGEIGDQVRAQSILDSESIDRSVAVTRMRKLSEALKDSDPTFLASRYDDAATKFGKHLKTTKFSDPENLEYMKIYRGLRPSAKLATLHSVVDENGVSEAFTESSFNSEILEMVKTFGLTEPDLLRGLKHKPQTIEDAKKANIHWLHGANQDLMNEGRIETIKLIARLPEAHRKRLLETIKIEDRKRNREAREFALKYAE